MSTDYPNLFENKIILFSNEGLLENYYRANLNVAQCILSSLSTIEDVYNESPFSNNIFTTDISDTNSFVSNTSIYFFTSKMKVLTENFIEEILNIMLENKESQRDANYRDIVNVSFFDNFYTLQTTYYKNLANYTTLFYWFHDMTQIPTFHTDVTEIIDSNLNINSYILSNKDHFLTTNVRQMDYSKFKMYRQIFCSFRKSFKICSLLNEQLVYNFNQDPNLVTNAFLNFLRFSKNINESIDTYIYNLDRYHEIVSLNEDLSNDLNYSQIDLETSLSSIVSNIASCNFVESIEIVDGSSNYELNQIISITSPETNGFTVTAVVTEIRDGHIRTIKIDNFNGGSQFSVGDRLIDQNDSNQNFIMEVNSIKNSVVHSVNIINKGEGFLVGDDSNNITFKKNNQTILEDFDLEIVDVKGNLDTIDISDDSNEEYKLDDIFEVSPDTNSTHEDDQNAEITVSEIDSKTLSNVTIQYESGSPSYQVEYDSNIHLNYGEVKFSMDIDSIHFDNEDVSLLNVNKTDSLYNDEFFLNWNVDSNKHTMVIKNILVDSNTIELDLDTNMNDNSFQIGDTHSPYIDNDTSKLLNTTVTEIQVPENSIQVKTDTNRNYSVYYSELDGSYIQYSGQNLQVVAGNLILDSNTVDIALKNPENASFTIDQTLEELYYANNSTNTNPISFYIDSISIDSNTINENNISLDTNQTQKLGVITDIVYGSDEANPISINIQDINVSENSIDVSKFTIDSSNINFSLETSGLNLSTYSFGTVVSNDTNNDIQLNLQPFTLPENQASTYLQTSTLQYDSTVEVGDVLATYFFGNVSQSYTIEPNTIPVIIQDTNVDTFKIKSYNISVLDTNITLNVTSIQPTEEYFENNIVFQNDTNINTFELNQDLSLQVGDMNLSKTIEEIQIVPSNYINLQLDTNINNEIGDPLDVSFAGVNINATVSEVNSVNVESNTISNTHQVSLLTIIDTNLITQYYSGYLNLYEISDNSDFAIYVTGGLQDYLTNIYGNGDSNNNIYVYLYKNETWNLINTIAPIISTSQEVYNWTPGSVHISSDGKYIGYSISNYLDSKIYFSSDYGTTFEQIFLNPSYQDHLDRIYIDFSDDGIYGLTGSTNNELNLFSGLQLTTNSASSFSPVFVSNTENDSNIYSLDFLSVSVSSTGQYMTVISGSEGGSSATPYQNSVFTSNNYGSNWTQVNLENSFNQVKISASGQYQTLIGEEYIFTSSDYGNTFTMAGGLTSITSWSSLAISPNGLVQIAVSNNGTFISKDFGQNFQLFTSDVFDVITFTPNSFHCINNTIPYEIVYVYTEGDSIIPNDTFQWANSGQIAFSNNPFNFSLEYTYDSSATTLDFHPEYASFNINTCFNITNADSNVILQQGSFYDLYINSKLYKFYVYSVFINQSVIPTYFEADTNLTLNQNITLNSSYSNRLLFGGQWFYNAYRFNKVYYDSNSMYGNNFIPTIIDTNNNSYYEIDYILPHNSDSNENITLTFQLKNTGQINKIIHPSFTFDNSYYYFDSNNDSNFTLNTLSFVEVREYINGSWSSITNTYNDISSSNVIVIPQTNNWILFGSSLFSDSVEFNQLTFASQDIAIRGLSFYATGGGLILKDNIVLEGYIDDNRFAKNFIIYDSSETDSNVTIDIAYNDLIDLPNTVTPTLEFVTFSQSFYTNLNFVFLPPSGSDLIQLSEQIYFSIDDTNVTYIPISIDSTSDFDNNEYIVFNDYIITNSYNYATSVSLEPFILVADTNYNLSGTNSDRFILNIENGVKGTISKISNLFSFPENIAINSLILTGQDSSFFNVIDTNVTGKPISYNFTNGTFDYNNKSEIVFTSLDLNNTNVLRFETENYDSNEIKLIVSSITSENKINTIDITNPEIIITNTFLKFKYGVTGTENLISRSSTTPPFSFNITHEQMNLTNESLIYKNGFDNTLVRNNDVDIHGTVLDFSISHDEIIAVNNSLTYDSSSLDLSIKNTPTGKINSFHFTLNDITLSQSQLSDIPLTPEPDLVDSNNDLSTIFKLTTQPTGYNLITTLHPSFIATNTNLSISNPSLSYITISSPVLGSIYNFSVQHNEMNQTLPNSSYNQNNSPYILKEGYPFGTPQSFVPLDDILPSDFIPTSNILHSNGNYLIQVYDYKNNLTGEYLGTTPDFQVGYISKPTNYFGSLDSNTLTIHSLGKVSSDDIITFDNTSLNQNKDSYNVSSIPLTIKGKLSLYSISNSGFGFSNVKVPFIVSYNGNNSISDTLIYNSSTITNGQIYNVTLLEGSQNISTSDTIYILKDGSTDSILEPSDIKDGVISSINIIDGGYNHSIGNSFTINKLNGTSDNNATFDVLSIDNGHIHNLSLLQKGSGFTNNSVVNIKNDPLGTVRVLTEIDEDMSILCLINKLNDNLK